MKYTVYVSSGKIVRLLDCDNIEQQLTNGESYLDGWFLDSQYYVDQNEAVQVPPQPSEYYVFDYTTKQWIDPRTPETQWFLVRQERKKKLQVSDWTQLSDISAETKALWEPYRQALRDITNQPDPFDIIWPTPPG